MITVKKDYTYALVAPTSMGVRISPLNGAPVHVSDTFYLQATSAETNVAGVLSSLGLPVKVLTAFVKGSPIAEKIKSELRARNIEYTGAEIEQDDPWGYRHQFNIADSGYGARGPRVYNDRAGEVGRLLNARLFDLERLFISEGVGILHLSGLICALSEETGKFCLALAKKAKSSGTLISFDLNYRASFWKNREKELYKIFNEIASISDILLGNEEDFQLALGVQGVEAGGNDLNAKISGFKEMISSAQKVYPNACVFATTLRQVISANEHLWGAVMFDGEDWHIIEPRQIGVLDRIGGGDAFAGGLLYGLVKGFKPEDMLCFGWACGAYAVTVLTDYIKPADEEQIWNIRHGNARIKR